MKRLPGHVETILKKSKTFYACAQKLKSATVWNIDNYIKYLANGDILERDYFINGQRSYHYRLNPSLLSGVRSIEIRPGTRLHDRIIQQQRLKRKHHDRLEPFLKEMNKRFMGVDLDYPTTREWIETQASEASKYLYHTSVSMFEDKRFRYFSRNKTNNRLDHNLTNLKSEIRNYILGDYVSIDLANSQPFFLSQLLKTLSQITTTTTTIPLCSGFFDFDLIQYLGKQQINTSSKIPQNDLFS